MAQTRAVPAEQRLASEPGPVVSGGRDTTATSGSAREWASIPVATALLVLAWGLLSGNIFLDGDPYWHVTVGKWIVAHRAVPTTEFYSHTMPGIAWTAHEWLSEVIMNATVTFAGWRGLHVLISICYALTAGYMMRFLLDRIEPIYAMTVCAVCLATVNTHFLGRPHVLAWPLIALWVGTLVTAVEQDERPPWWLLLLVPIWTNLHASFTLAIGFAGALALDAVWTQRDMAARRAAARRWAPFMVACVLGVLINPRGVHALTHAAGVMNMTKTLDIVSEWRSADFHQFQFFLIWLLCVMAAAFVTRMRLSFPRVLFILGLVYLALKHQRYHSLAGLVSPFILAAPLGAALRQMARSRESNAAGLDAFFLRRARPAGWRGVALAAVAACVLVPATWRLIPSEPSVRFSPNAALQAFRATGVEGRVLNSYGLGGFLIAKGVPVYIDGRGDMYGDTFMEETSNALGLTKPRALETVLSKYKIGWTLISPGTPAIELLDHLPAWQRVFADTIAVVHVRRDLLDAAKTTSTTGRTPAR